MITNLSEYAAEKRSNYNNFEYFQRVKTLLDIIIDLGKAAEQTEIVKELQRTAETEKKKINEEIYRSFPGTIKENL